MTKICVSSSHYNPDLDEKPASADQKHGVHPADGMPSRNSPRDRSTPVFADRLLSDRGTAVRYKVEKQTILRWTRTSKHFPKPFKIEGTARWSENELDAHDLKLQEARQ